ncbi:MAG TPA: DUF6600 domain-containing protein [Casimicrobiaceae bacterium]|nr:DUF6600 domain-containing protein [Casimicrobiaceae bacterium]
MNLYMPVLRRESEGSMLRAARAICALAVAGFAAFAHAQDDLPGRVGRVANVAGELFLAPQDKPDAWNAIGINYPVTSGDNLWVGSEGRAEVDFGAGQVRLAGDSNIHVSRLDDRNFALFVAQGRVSTRVRVLDPGDTTRIDTPNAQVAITRPGLYRVDVSPDREHTHIVVREGEVNVLTAGGVQQVLPGQSADVDGTDPRLATVQNGIGIDGFDTWAADRDRYYSARANNYNNYVSPQMVGAADLGQYGTWSQVPEYGNVWYPDDVPADWAPYRNGYWVSVGAWGPTWVDYAPWGYAPFHYGRWVFVGSRWGWCPGTFVARPLWAPALVAWTGGPGWSVSVGVGAPVYGWVPLAWGEPYRPWWGRCSYGCWDRFNRPYAVNVAVVRPSSPPPTFYRNWNAPGGVTAVSSAAFVARRPVQENLVRVPREAVASVPVMSSAPLIRNDVASRAVAQRPVSAPPAASTLQPAIARQAPQSVSRANPAPAEQGFTRARPVTSTTTPSSQQSLAQPQTMRSAQPQSVQGAQSTPPPQGSPGAVRAARPPTTPRDLQSSQGTPHTQQTIRPQTQGGQPPQAQQLLRSQPGAQTPPHVAPQGQPQGKAAESGGPRHPGEHAGRESAAQVNPGDREGQRQGR